MNDIERIKQILGHFLNLMRDDSTNSYTRGILLDLMRQINELNQPPQPEGYQGLNKWYRTSIGHIIYAVSINQFNCYGIRVKSEINKETHWCNDFSLQYDNINRLATESEIKEAILKGCEQNGILEGARVKSLKTNEIKKLEFGKYILDYSKKLNIACYMGVTVFNNGKFAEVVKDFNCEDGNCIKQCDKCKDSFDTKPTDKELLKECANYFQGIINNQKPFSGEMHILLTKLNKHLNYE